MVKRRGETFHCLLLIIDLPGDVNREILGIKVGVRYYRCRPMQRPELFIVSNPDDHFLKAQCSLCPSVRFNLLGNTLE
jgi:hypothetical protein